MFEEVVRKYEPIRAYERDQCKALAIELWRAVGSINQRFERECKQSEFLREVVDIVKNLLDNVADELSNL